MQKQDDDYENFLAKKKQPGLDALTFFVSKFSPANKEDAELFWSTTEISNAVADLTGVRLQPSDIFEMMLKMGYKYDSLESLEFVWLVNKQNINLFL